MRSRSTPIQAVCWTAGCLTAAIAAGGALGQTAPAGPATSAPATALSPVTPASQGPAPATGQGPLSGSRPDAALSSPGVAAPAAAVNSPTPPVLKSAAPPAPRLPPEPMKRPRYASAILQGVDKITAETLRFEAKVGEPVRYKGLILTVHACETSAPDEGAPEAAAHLEVQSQPEMLAGGSTPPPRLVYRGWMFASSPTLHPFEHPVYDLWLIACRTDGPVAPGSSR